MTPNIVRSYDAAGRLLSSANGISVCSYSYDNANQELSETQNAGVGSGWTVGYTYDADGNRTSLSIGADTFVGAEHQAGYNGQWENSLDYGAHASVGLSVVGTTVGPAYGFGGNVARDLDTGEETECPDSTIEQDNSDPKHEKKLRKQQKQGKNPFKLGATGFIGGHINFAPW